MDWQVKPGLPLWSANSVWLVLRFSTGFAGSTVEARRCDYAKPAQHQKLQSREDTTGIGAQEHFGRDFGSGGAAGRHGGRE
jgi:hypothetical protein